MARRRKPSIAGSLFMRLCMKIWPERHWRDTAAEELGVTKRTIYDYSRDYYPIPRPTVRFLVERIATNMAVDWIKRNPNRHGHVPSLRRFYAGDHELPRNMQHALARRVIQIIERCGYAPREQL